MPSPKEEHDRLSDRLPSDWKRRRANYSASCAANYERVLRKLAAVNCMSQDECERAAYVIIEKEEFRKQGIVLDDED